MLICVVKDACTKCYQLPCAKLVTFVDPGRFARCRCLFVLAMYLWSRRHWKQNYLFLLWCCWWLARLRSIGHALNCLILSYRYYCFLAESLLWFLGIVRLFTQPAMPQPTLVAVLLETMEKKAPENAALRGEPFISLANSRRCKASRPRMKQADVNLLCSEFGFVIKV